VVLVGVCVAVVTGACSPRDNGDEPQVAVRVIDSAYAPTWEPTADSGTIYRVEIRSPAGVDTIGNVVPPFPTVTGDTLVVGLLQVSEDSSTPERKIFRLRLGQHRVETLPVPSDVWSSFHDVVVSPDGRYLAYVAEDTTPSIPATYGLVRELATGAIIIKGPGGGGCDCDVDTNHARWFAPDSFEIAVSHENTDNVWLLLSGVASARRLHVDTLSEEPNWH
jgi:hypothetical protein